MNLLSPVFLAEYPDQPSHMNELGSFVFYRTYSRWLPELKRRETWKEAVARAVDYNVSIAFKHYHKIKMDFDFREMVREAEALFDNVFNLRQFLSGRTHWVGGADSGVADKFPLANFNCSFLNIQYINEKQNDLADLFYLLLVGTGVGFKCTKEMASRLPAMRTGIEYTHLNGDPVEKADRLEFTEAEWDVEGVYRITVGDSKEGWVEALRQFFYAHYQTKNEITKLIIDYNHIRPKGERLKTFGGTASGSEPLLEMFDGFSAVINNRIDSTLAPLEEVGDGFVQLRPIHILDMGNLIGNNVVVGGVRRTAEIFLCDSDDWECILAKYGINGVWNAKTHTRIGTKLAKMGVLPTWWNDFKLNDPNARPLHHRRMSNNSIAFTKKPSKDMMRLLFLLQQGEGEPGFVNLESAGKRRYNAEGLNPCAEILLDTYGVCNLTTVNVMAFVYEDKDGNMKIDSKKLLAAQELSARAGLRMTLLDLELPHWDNVQKRDRLTGCSLTGWQDAVSTLGADLNWQKYMLKELQMEATEVSHMYAHHLRIPAPILITTVKPEGTLSQVAGGVSSGLHFSHSPYYIRRIRINASDALATLAKKLGWTVNPEVGTDGSRTVVIDFPIKSGATRTKDDVSVEEQFVNYFAFQAIYTQHNSSNTITVRPSEWKKAEKIVTDNWDDFVGVSFLSHDGGSYQLAPYEAITEEQYVQLKEKMAKFDAKLLEELEAGDYVEDLSDQETCENGVCPIR